MYKALGTKRLASDEFVHDWDNKRLNIGHVSIYLFCYVKVDSSSLCHNMHWNVQTNGQQQSITGFDHPGGTIADSKAGMYMSYSNMTSGVSPSLQVPMLLPQQAAASALLGKG